MIDVCCVKNYGYKWTADKDVFFKGFFILDKVLYTDALAVEYFSLISDYNDFVKAIKKLNGNFAIIVRKENELWSAVDCARSIPIYFSKCGNIVSDCAETIRKKLAIDRENVNIKDLTFLLCIQFTFLNHTVYDDIKQLGLGQTLLIRDNSVKYEYYYRHTANVININREEASIALENALSDTFDRVIAAINNRPVLLSLSGGYDSRIVACMLKEKGVSDITCYTYGGINSYEVEISRKVAEQLGYKWHCVTYSDDDIKSIFSPENSDFFDMASTHDYIIYLQNYLAVKKLKEQNVIKSNSVVITGLCGDMPSGAYVLPREQLEGIDLSYDNIVNTYVDRLFDQFKIKKDMRKKLKGELIEDLKKCDTKLENIQNYVTLKDCLETAGVHSRSFLQANRAHEFFGFEWLLPLWDKEYLNFWYSLPMEYRAYQNLYEDYAMNKLFAKYNIDFKKMKAVRPTDKNVKKMGKKLKKKMKYFLGGILTRASFMTKIPIKRRIADPNNFGAATILLYENISYRKAINYKKANFAHLLNVYILEKRYGIY